MSIKTVYVLSDSVGETAELVLKAGLSQFNSTDDYNIQRIPYVTGRQTVEDALQVAKEQGGVVGFTLVDPKLREYIIKRSSALNLEVIDIMGPMLTVMERAF